MTAIGAVDIGGTKLAVGIVDENGRVLSRMESPSRKAEGYHDGLELITKMLGQMSRDAGLILEGIGIGSTGPVDSMTGCFGDLDFLPRWKGANICGDLQRHFHVPVALENDADAAALAEAGWGAGRNKSRLIYVTIGTGIGGGIINTSGPHCSCGFEGCWDSLAAGPAMVRWMESQPECRH